MPVYRSATSTSGRNMAGARALWRATGVKGSGPLSLRRRKFRYSHRRMLAGSLTQLL